MRWPRRYRIPLELSRAELYWLARLFLAWAYRQHLIEEATRAFFAHYNTPAARRLDALYMRETPFMRRIREDAGRTTPDPD